ncbi:MAG: tRNA lysidine(34) synthetase TilS [Lachnospiraceae bacterium]|nr:tRNA lysidine(34) synthetase TilS [Lachnospiraceae bacterium]
MEENSAGWPGASGSGRDQEEQRKMKERFFHVIEEYRMIEPGESVIAGVSGGADSVCLLHLLCRLREEIPFSLMVVHVEHGLRGQESLDDAAFVEALCESWQVPRRVVHVDVPALSLAEGMSHEEAGRAARYRIFEETAAECQAQRIAVAHNQNDQAETVLWNLARGSGLKGLGGIRPVQGKLIRPLLFFSRDEIEEYLRAEGLSWRTDRTNLETEFTRNRIRLSLLPQMERELNRQSARHIAEAAGRLQKVQEYLDQRTEAAAARCILTDEAMGSAVHILLEPFGKEEPLIREELLKRAIQMCAPGMKDIGAVHLDMLTRLAEMDCGKRMDLPGGIRAEREGQIIRIFRRGISHLQSEDAKDASPIENRFAMGDAVKTEADGIALPVPGTLRLGDFSLTTELVENTPDLKKEILKENQCTKWLSCDTMKATHESCGSVLDLLRKSEHSSRKARLSSILAEQVRTYDTIKNSLRIRTRKPGDYLVVNAQGGTKKLNDYFTDQKIPTRVRDEILLLADGSHILWVIGYRISETAKVREDTRQILKCTYRTAETEELPDEEYPT